MNRLLIEMLPDPNKIHSLTLKSFPKEGVRQAFFGRKGGISPIPWDSLNLGGTVGDKRENVLENRQRLFDAFQRPVESLYDVWQVHSADVVCASAPRPLGSPHVQADGILTDSPDVTLLMRFADCVPLLYFDPVQRVIGIAHAGWQGTLKKIASAMVERMKIEYRSDPKDILVGIGPSIGPECYQIGAEVAEKVKIALDSQASKVLHYNENGIWLDLWESNRLILNESGVEQIEILGVCTACHRQDWFSHRADKGKTGRFAAVISLG